MALKFENKTGKLFPDSEVFVKERPDTLTPTQKDSFYLVMAQEVINNGWSDYDVIDIATDLSELYLYDTGFEMAKDIECKKANYNIDTEFIEWLENLESEYRERVSNNVKEWVKAHDVKPLYKIGDKFKINSNLNRELVKGMDVYITNIYPETAHYIIHEDKDYKGGTYINFETVEFNCTKID